MPKRGAPVEVLQRVPLFADLSKHEVRQIARLFKERNFAAGEVVIQEGSGGAAFFVIETGEASVSIHSRVHTTLKPGEYFGEIVGRKRWRADDHQRNRGGLDHRQEGTGGQQRRLPLVEHVNDSGQLDDPRLQIGRGVDDVVPWQPCVCCESRWDRKRTQTLSAAADRVLRGHLYERTSVEHV